MYLLLVHFAYSFDFRLCFCFYQNMSLTCYKKYVLFYQVHRLNIHSYTFVQFTILYLKKDDKPIIQSYCPLKFISPNLLVVCWSLCLICATYNNLFFHVAKFSNKRALPIEFLVLAYCVPVTIDDGCSLTD